MDRLDYRGEYYISISDDNELFVEPVWHCGNCFTAGADLHYFFDGCDTDIISHLEEGYIFKVIIGDSE